MFPKSKFEGAPRSTYTWGSLPGPDSWFFGRRDVFGCEPKNRRMLSKVCAGGLRASPLSAQEVKGEADAQASPKLRIPTDNQLATLIVSTLIALNQANFTGNYSVIRELGSPNFQGANSSGRLSEIFADLRNRGFDFSPIILLQPKLLRKPAIDNRGMLRLTGFFPTAPERLNFDLLYEFVGGRWLLFGIAANTTLVQTGAPAN